MCARPDEVPPGPSSMTSEHLFPPFSVNEKEQKMEKKKSKKIQTNKNEIKNMK